MIDVKRPLRKAYYELLNGNLTSGGNAVPVGDDVVEDTADVYVILAAQSGSDNSTFQSFDSIETIDLDIVYKGGAFVNKGVVDNVANQILQLVVPSPQVNALPAQIGVQVNCVELTGDRYLDFGLNNSDSVVRRILTYTQKVRQTGTTTPPDPGDLFKSPITQADFSTATEYFNTTLSNLEFYVFLNDASVYLKENVDWQHITGGGIKILLPGFDATIDVFTIYLILK